MKKNQRSLFYNFTSIVLLVIPLLVHAAPGELDITFDTGAGVNNTVNAIAVQPDGKVIIGGGFKNAKGASRNGIARLNSDGTIDTSFNPGVGIGDLGYIYPVNSVVMQSDGRIIVVGRFATFDGVSRSGIARLNSNGSLDTSFNPGSGVDNVYSVSAVIVQTDGKIVIGGSFPSVNGTSRRGIARLNVDGTLDNSFDPGTGLLAGASVDSIAIQPDGKLVIGGLFTAVINGTNRNYIARLNTNGTVDSSFNPGTSANNEVLSVALQTDGKVLICGFFTQVAGATRNGIARLNSNGSLDTAFNPISGANDAVYSVAAQSDGKVIIGGDFTQVNGVTKTRIARLTSTGSNDSTLNFNLGTGANARVSTIKLQPDGKILFGGDMTLVNGASRNRIARLNTNGNLDASFDAGTGVDETPALNKIEAIAVQPDGKVLIGGWFSSINGTSRGKIARLNADGFLDMSFNPGSGVQGDAVTLIDSIALQSSGKIVIGGRFTGVNGTNRTSIARLNANGSLDPSFSAILGGITPEVYAVVAQPDDKLLLCGGFSSVNGVARDSIARLNSDGSLDTAFNPTMGGGYCIAIQPDGKILTGNSLQFGLTRLNPNGTVDPSFTSGSGANDTVRSIAFQSDGKIIIGGDFTAVNGIGRIKIARLNTNGTLDESVDPGIGVQGSVYSVAVQADDKIVLGGLFFQVQGVDRDGIARLNSDGSTLDTSFDPGAGFPGVYCVVLQKQGKVLIGGSLPTFNGSPRGNIAQLLGDAASLVYGPVRTNNNFVARFLGTPGLNYTLESRTNIASGTWQKLINKTAPLTDTGLGIGVFELQDSVTPSPQKFYRAVYPSY